jgi:hypothetical protein
MATVVTVHGTYAHIVGPPDTPAPAELQWWQPGSGCEKHIRELVDGADGSLTFDAFTWSGENSERARRRAGSALLAKLRELERRKEPYCLIGHSHGGSVIAAALLQSVAKGVPLESLKKWITVATPFVALRKERFLFSRLTLPRKVLFVASLMLLMMFLIYLGFALFDQSLLGRREGQFWRLGFSATMMSLPFIAFYIFLKILDARRYYYYLPKVLAEAEKRYGDRWLALNHDDDEAVQGLRLLPRVKMRFFESGFAVPTLTLAAILVLPLAYLFVVTSPPLMVAIADVLKNRVYDVDDYRQTEPAVESARQQTGALRRKLFQARETAEKSGLDASRAESARQEADALRRQLAETRRRLLEAHPDLPKMQRAERFKRRFLERDGKPCDGGKLCGGGENYGLNSALLFHIVTDELASAFVDEDTRWGPLGGLVRLWLPIVLVPVFFALLALLILVLVRFLAVHVSAFMSRRLNGMTRHEITRSALGNDTEGEIAVGADNRPAWMSRAYSFLPGELSNKIADYSNQVSFQSLAKFRNAISTLAFSVDEEGTQGILTTYLTWRELIHTSYFEVPEFRKLIAYAIAHAEGFAAGERLRTDPDFDRAASWHGALRLHEPIA